MIVQHGFSRHNLCCEKSLLSTIFGLVSTSSASKNGHLLSLIRLTKICRDLIPNIILISFFQPTPSPLHQPRCLTIASLMHGNVRGRRNAAFHVIRKRISSASKRTRTCGKFPPSHQNFKSQFFTSFCSTFRALCHFLRERVWEIYHRIYFGLEDVDDDEQRKARRESKIESELGVGDKHPWNKMRRQKNEKASPKCFLP